MDSHPCDVFLQLVSLNLSSNRLLSLRSIEEMVSRAPNVTALDLGRNQVRAAEELDKLKGWNLTTLTLDKNPLCDKFPGSSEYVRYTRDVP